MRQSAYLNAVPARDARDKHLDGPQLSRLEQLRSTDEHFQPAMPPVEAGACLLSYFYEIGPTTGDAAISFQEIAAWCELTGIALRPWEARALRLMSIEYRNESYRARQAGAVAPWTDADVPKWKRIQAQMRALRNL